MTCEVKKRGDMDLLRQRLVNMVGCRNFGHINIRKVRTRKVRGIMEVIRRAIREVGMVWEYEGRGKGREGYYGILP